MFRICFLLALVCLFADFSESQAGPVIRGRGFARNRVVGRRFVQRNRFRRAFFAPQLIVPGYGVQTNFGLQQNYALQQNSSFQQDCGVQQNSSFQQDCGVQQNFRVERRSFRQQDGCAQLPLVIPMNRVGY